MSTPVAERSTATAADGARSPGTSPEEPLDVFGGGYGPSNLSLAVLIEEINATRAPVDRIQARFVEMQAEFGWHVGMLLPGTDMQISFLKDLVTQRNPRSRYTFINYLYEDGRLPAFINLHTFAPSRREFMAYLRWVAEQVDAEVDYSTRVASVDDHGSCYAIRVEQVDGTSPPQTWYARNVVLGTGIVPELPAGVETSSRVFHNHRVLFHLDNVPSFDRKSFLVVGSGQSAAEVTQYLHSTYPEAEIHSVYRRFGYTPSDDTPFANQIFDPVAVDEFYDMPDGVKSDVLRKHLLTNYSAVDADLIEDLYRRWYDELVSGKPRLHFHRVSHVAGVADKGDRVVAEIAKLGAAEGRTVEVDAAIFATGFTPGDPRALLGPSVEHTRAFDDADRPLVDRDYRLQLPGYLERNGGIYLNGNVEHSHGLTSSLLSNVSIRSQDIMDSLLASGQSIPTE